MTDFTKIVRIGTQRTHGGRSYSVFCKIKFINGELSISGVEGPLDSGNALGGCGQIVDGLTDIVAFAPGWNKTLMREFRSIWREWHLNHMVPGTPEQMAFLKTTAKGERQTYDWAVGTLRDAGLISVEYEGKPYRYGTAWLKKEVPADVIDFLKSLPDSDKQPAWV
jgi:hypothetical protein